MSAIDRQDVREVCRRNRPIERWRPLLTEILHADVHTPRPQLADIRWDHSLPAAQHEESGSSVGASDEPLEVNLTHLLIGSKTITGEIVGTAIDEDDTLDFSVLQGIRPMVETIPLEEAQAGYDTMMRNEARFRIVLTMN